MSTARRPAMTGRAPRAQPPAPPRTQRGQGDRNRALRSETENMAGGLRALFPVPDVQGPKVALGLLWAVVTVAALIAGPVALAVWLGLIAAAASAQAARTWRRPGGVRPAASAAFAIAGCAAVASAFGPVVLAAVGVVAAAGAAAWAVTAEGRRGIDVVLTLVCAAVPAAAVVGPILLRRNGLEAAVVVIAYAVVYDAGSWIMGTGARRRWVGPLAGVACIAPVTLAVAASTSQFTGASAWVLGALAAVLAPLGPAAATLVLGDRRVAVPALRRLDSLVLLGPLWAVAAVALGV